MAATSNPTGNAPTAFILKTDTSIDTVVLDCSVNEGHTAENDVTDHPVEKGFAVTDHVRNKPDTLSIEGVISNTPFSRSQQLRTVEAFGITFDSATDQDLTLGQPGYAEQGYMALRAIRDGGNLITVTTSLRTYDSMVMTSLVVPRSKDTGDALRFTAQFKLVRVVSNKLAAAKKSSSPGKKVSGGKQVAKPTDAATQKKSIAYDIKEGAPAVLNKIKGLVGGAP